MTKTKPKKKPPKKVKTIDIFNPIFKNWIIVFKGTPYEDAKKYAEKKMLCEFLSPKSLEACVFNCDDVQNQVIWFKHKRPTKQVVAHEAFHAITHNMKMKASRLTDDTEEIYAYLLEWLVWELSK